MKTKRLFILGLVLVAILAGLSALACTGEQGLQGEQGERGPMGPTGPTAAEYIGSATCAACHEDQADIWANSGHAYKLNKVVDGVAPTYPYTTLTNPPTGYTWDDITYVIGGYIWKARFIDSDGYIITGADENATTQYNFANDTVDTDAGWVGYHAGEENTVYDCGGCHTTGYNPEGHQDDLPGLIGTWAEDGIGCESCHGPGSNHANNPYGVALEIDRDAEACGDCHLRGAAETIDASGGFIKHHEQYEELFQSKHRALDCIDCHDPHKGVIQGRETETATTVVDCESCHFKEVRNQASNYMKNNIDCIDCHMPRITKSAVGDADAYTGDIRTHFWAIDPEATSQFSEDGSTAISQVGLDFACKSCHRIGGSGADYSDSTLKNVSTGYHD
jgi:hypothetical protein